MNGDVKIYHKYDVEGMRNAEKAVSSATYAVIKRMFDFVCGLVGVICLIPLTIIVKICSIVTGDFKSIFYTQPRIGKDGKIFQLYKFRSMVPDADKVLNELLEKDEKLAEEYKIHKKIENDPRITKIGKILRKTSLDETPQFINVLRGDMSLIGNRPYLEREREDMGGYYEDIIKTKPGITGYWQVEGRSSTTFQKRLELEQYYSKHASLKMDIKIFFKTFEVVLLSKGAK